MSVKSRKPSNRSFTNLIEYVTSYSDNGGLFYLYVNNGSLKATQLSCSLPGQWFRRGSRRNRCETGCLVQPWHSKNTYAEASHG